MQRAIYAVIATAALAIGALALRAQTLSIIPFAGGGYSGPGNVVTFTAFWGVRAYNAAYAAPGTGKCCDLRRASDNATCTALFKTTGALDLTVGTPCNGNTQTVTAWVGASSAFVSKMYDQVAGNACGGSSCDVLQATAANQPQLLLTGCGASGTLPCLKTTGATAARGLTSANNFTPTGTTMSMALVGFRPVLGSPQTNPISANNTTNDSIGFTGNNLWKLGALSGTATDNVWHSANGAIVNTTGTSTLNIDGTETTSTSLSYSTAAGTPTLATTSAFASNSISVGEGGFVNATAWSAAQRTALCHNMRLYWGTAGSC